MVTVMDTKLSEGTKAEDIKMNEPGEHDDAASLNCETTVNQDGRHDKDYQKWLVAITTFLIFIITGGVYYTGGIIAPELLASFPQNGETSVSVIISMVPSLMNFAALFAGCFCELYGELRVCLVGSVLIASGFFLSSFVSTNIGFLYFTYGFLTGTGLGFQFLPCIVIVQKYFPKRHALATSVTYSGASIGAFLFAFILRYLIDLYTWRGGMLLMAAITFHAVAFSFVLVPPKWTRDLEDQKVNEDHQRQGSSSGIANCTNGIKVLFSNIKKVFQKLAQGVKDLKEPQFTLMVFAHISKQLEAAVPYVFLPLKLLSLEYTKWQVATLVAILGIGDFVGRLLVGVQSVTCKFSGILFFASALFVTGATEVIVGMVTDYYGLCACACCLAICGGVCISSIAPLLLDVMGQERVPRCYGLVGIGRGIASLISLPLQAVIYEVSGNIDIPFYVCGCFPVLGGFLMISVFFLQRKAKVVQVQS